MPSQTTQVQYCLKDLHRAHSNLATAKGKKEKTLCEQNVKTSQRNVIRQDSQNLSDLAFKAKFLQDEALVAFIGRDPEKLTFEQHILWSLVRDIRLLAAKSLTGKLDAPLEDAIGLISVLSDTHDKLDENGRGTLLTSIDQKMSQLHDQCIEVSDANYLPLPPDDEEFAAIYTQHKAAA